jgi:hypothetical protein
MLADARSRIVDQSGLGQHLAIVGADGVGELAIGICAHKRGVLRRDAPLPATLSRLLSDLSAKGVPGEQGFKELHAARNQAQHQGILPAPEQLPRWLDETEALVTYLVERCFGVNLSTVGSASAVDDERLRGTLSEAEQAIEEGQAKQAIELCWQAAQAGLATFKRHTGLGGDSPKGSLGRELSDVRAIEDKIASLERQLELSLFASEPGEWMWFEQCREETARGLEPTIGEARRGFVFVLSWVLRMESYVSRHGADRWERWQQLRAPKTGLPGGPHIQDVSRGTRPLLSKDETEWVIQLTDVPDFENPDFGWAISAAQEHSDDPNLKHAYLSRAGELVVRVPLGATPTEIATLVRKLIPEAHEVMRDRIEDDQKEAGQRAKLLEPFLGALASSALPVKEALIRPADRGQGPLVAYIELSGVGSSGRSWFSKCLHDCFGEHLEGHDAQKCQMGFAGAVVPADWPPEKVAAWLADAKKRADDKDRADREAEQGAQEEKDRFLLELKSQITGEA